MISPETVPCILARKVLSPGKYRYTSDIYTIFKVENLEQNHSDGTLRVNYHYWVNDGKEEFVFNEYNTHFIENAVFIE